MFSLGFPAGDYIVEKLKLASGILSVKAVKTKGAEDYISFPTDDAPYSVRESSVSGETEIEFPCEKIAGDSLVIDAEKVLGKISADAKRYPAFESGYLIVKNSNYVNYLECNVFVRSFLEEVLI
jgi:hypothetical protein